MPIITNTGEDLYKTYKGFELHKVGAGTDPKMYATPEYSSKKIQSLIIGGVSKIIYGGFDHQPDPLILSMGVEAGYNTVICLNLAYIPIPVRRQIIELVLKSNYQRIKSNLPMIIDYQMLKKAFQETKFIVRRYKQTLIRVVESFSLLDWQRAVVDEGTKWESHYKLIQRGILK